MYLNMINHFIIFLMNALIVLRLLEQPIWY